MPTTHHHARFARELEALIRKHLGKPQWGDDILPIAQALHEAADRVDWEADRLRFRDESEQEFKARRARHAR
jgi:hypothetical protein